MAHQTTMPNSSRITPEFSMKTSSFRKGKGQSRLYHIKPRIRVFPEGNIRFSINHFGSVFYGYGNTIETAIQDAIKNKQMIYQLLDTILDDTDHRFQTNKMEFTKLKQIYAWIRDLICRK